MTAETSNPPPTRIPEKLMQDPEVRQFLLALTRSLYFLWAHSRSIDLTTQETTITHTAPGTADYAIQNLTNSSPFGFVTADEGNTLLQVVKNLQTRVQEIEDHFSG